LKLKIYGGLVLFFLLLLGAAYLVIYSPIFKVRNFNINQISQGPLLLDEKESEKLKNDLLQDLKGFFTSRSQWALILGPDNILIWLASSSAATEINKRYPQIYELSIKRDVLNKEISVDFKKREKFGIWCLQTQTYADHTQTNAEENQRESALSPRESALDCFWFDDQGIVFAEAPQAEGDLIYRVNDYSGRTLKFGDAVLNEELLTNLFKIFEVLDKAGLQIKSLKLENLQFQEIMTDSPSASAPKIYFSLRNNPQFALEFLKSLDKLNLSNVTYIDLRIENRVYYK